MASHNHEHEHDHGYMHAHGIAHSHGHVHENQKAVINRLARAMGHLDKEHDRRGGGPGGFWKK